MLDLVSPLHQLYEKRAAVIRKGRLAYLHRPSDLKADPTYAPNGKHPRNRVDAAFSAAELLE